MVKHTKKKKNSLSSNCSVCYYCFDNFVQHPLSKWYLYPRHTHFGSGISIAHMSIPVRVQVDVHTKTCVTHTLFLIFLCHRLFLMLIIFRRLLLSRLLCVYLGSVWFLFLTSNARDGQSVDQSCVTRKKPARNFLHAHTEKPSSGLLQQME